MVAKPCPRHARLRPIDQEGGNFRAIARRARGPRGHDQLVGAVAVEHDRLFPAEPPARAVALGARLDMEGSIAAGGLGIGQRQRGLAGHHGAQELVALLRRGQPRDEAAAQHGRRQKGLQHQRAAIGLVQQHEFDPAAADAAVLLGEGHGEQPEFGRKRPDLGGIALGLARETLARVEAIAFARHPPDGVGEHALFVAD